MSATDQSGSGIWRRRVRPALLYAAVGLIALSALGASLWLRDAALEAREDQLAVVHLLSLTEGQMLLLEETLHEEVVDGVTHHQWSTARQEGESLVRELKGDDRLVIALDERLYFFNDYGRELFGYVASGQMEAAQALHEARLHQELEAVRRHLQELDGDRGDAADQAHAAATLGTLVGFAVAALLIGFLLRTVQRSRRTAAVSAAETAARRRGERRFGALVENASDMIFVLDSRGVVTLASGAVEEQLGRSAESVIGTRLVDLLHPDDVELAVPLLAEAVEHQPRVASTEWRMAREDRSYAHVETIARDLTQEGEVGGLVLTTRDISERKAFEEQLRHQAFHDPLTNLPNRALFDDRVAHALSLHTRDDSNVSVLFVDLDDFKAINDGLGHAAGDQLLIAVAGRLRACLRSADTAARLGGDEFGVLLEGLDHPSQASTAAKRVLDALREPFFIHGDPVNIEASIGLAVAPAGKTKAEHLVRDADVAMYLAKHNGKGRFEVYDRDVQQDLLENLDISAEEADDGITWFLRSEGQRAEIEALLDDENSITPVFQPILELATGRVVGYEALARFPDTERPPNTWFSQAHRYGLGVELEMQALRAALRVPGRPEGTYLSLNVSPSAVVSDLLDESLPEDLSSIVFEILENELIGEGSRLEHALDRLRRRGARIAIDDTGSGYAGLKQLMRLRPEIIKLDRSLISGLHTDIAKRALVDAMVRYASRIDASVCAEGVESLDELRALVEIEIGSAQGYGLARPGPPWAVVDPKAAAVCTAALGVAAAEIASGSTQEVFAAITEGASQLLGDDIVALRLVDPADPGYLLTVSVSGLDPELVRRIERMPVDQGVTGQVVRDGKLLVVDDYSSTPEALAEFVEDGITAVMSTPIFEHGKPVGILSVASRVPHRAYSRAEQEALVAFAEHASLALAGSRRPSEVGNGSLRLAAEANDVARVGEDVGRAPAEVGERGPQGAE